MIWEYVYAFSTFWRLHKRSCQQRESNVQSHPCYCCSSSSYCIIPISPIPTGSNLWPFLVVMLRISIGEQLLSTAVGAVSVLPPWIGDQLTSSLRTSCIMQHNIILSSGFSHSIRQQLLTESLECSTHVIQRKRYEKIHSVFSHQI